VVHLNVSAVPHGLNIPAKAVAKPTNRRTTSGRNVRTPLRLVPRSGVMLDEMHPIGVAFSSPYFIRRVVVKVVKA
jgi:hypothetical protein